MRRINFADEIKNSISMPEMAEYYGYTPNRAGFICCPFHSEKTNSCKCYPNKGGFHCFGCNEGGSVIDFVMKLFGLNFKDAVIKINADFNLHLPIGEKPSLRQYREAQRMQAEYLKQKAEYDKLQNEYHRAFDYWCRLDKAINNPESPDYVEALKNISIAEYNLEETEMRLHNYENRR